MQLYQRLRRLASAAADTPVHLQAVETKLADLAGAVAALDARVSALAQPHHLERDLNQLRGSLVRLAEMTARKSQSRASPVPNLVAPNANPSRQEVFAELAQRYPRVYPLWEQLFANGLRSYLDNPDDNLSTAGHSVAPVFKAYIERFARGCVLDIGCGPQKLPYYLAGLDIARVAAIDPLEPVETHPFVFRLGVAETIPWPDASFETAISATSLDHVISLRDSLAEIGRVLSEGGRFIVWVGFMPDGRPFDPLQDNPAGAPVGADEYHLFHFGEGWMEEVFAEYFWLEDRTRIDASQSFYVFRKLGAVS